MNKLIEKVNSLIIKSDGMSSFRIELEMNGLIRYTLGPAATHSCDLHTYTHVHTQVILSISWDSCGILRFFGFFEGFFKFSLNFDEI